MEMQMQLPREGVEALSVARPAVDEPQVPTGSPGRWPCRHSGCWPCARSGSGTRGSVWPVISALETQRKSWCFREGLSGAARLRQLHSLVRCSTPAVRAPRGPTWAPTYLRPKWWGDVCCLSPYTPNTRGCSLNACVERAAGGGAGRVAVLPYSLLPAGFLPLAGRVRSRVQGQQTQYVGR